jgi:DNA primase
LFDKSSTVYAVNLLKKAASGNNIDCAILAEGYFDVIALHQAGFNTAVASMGTSLTSPQARLLKRFSPNVIVSYDGDEAGQKATLKSLDILKEAGLNVKVLALPAGLDPDDYIKKYGVEAYEDAIRSAVPMFDYKLECLKREFDLGTGDGKTRFTLKALDFVRKQKNAVEQEEYLKRIQDVTGYTLDSLKKQLSENVIEDNIKHVLTNQKIYGASERAARYLLRCLINKEPFLADLGGLSFRVGDFLTDDAEREIFNAFTNPKDKIVGAFDEDTLSPSAFECFTELSFSDFGLKTPEEFSEYYSSCLRFLEKEYLTLEIDALSKKYETAAPDEKMSILSEINQLTQKINNLKNN